MQLTCSLNLRTSLGPGFDGLENGKGDAGCTEVEASDNSSSYFISVPSFSEKLASVPPPVMRLFSSPVVGQLPGGRELPKSEVMVDGDESEVPCPGEHERSMVLEVSSRC